jgi:hypothetical protein
MHRRQGFCPDVFSPPLLSGISAPDDTTRHSLPVRSFRAVLFPVKNMVARFFNLQRGAIK